MAETPEEELEAARRAARSAGPVMTNPPAPRVEEADPRPLGERVKEHLAGLPPLHWSTNQHERLAGLMTPRPAIETPFDATTVFHGPTAPLFAALARAQGAFPAIPRTRAVTVRMKAEKGGGVYTYVYAPLENVIDACRAALADNGLAFLETILELKEGRVLLAYLTHASGSYMEGRILLGAAKDAQEFGSHVTYARRYQRQCMLGVSPEDDNDGSEGDAERVPQSRHSDPAPPKPTPAAKGSSGPASSSPAPAARPAAPEAPPPATSAIRKAFAEFEIAIACASNRAEVRKCQEILAPFEADPEAVEVMKDAEKLYTAAYKAAAK